MPCLFVFVFVFFLPNPPQLSMGMLGMGFIATYLPDAAISAYLAAVAMHIIVAQMTCIFGIMVSFHAGPISFIYVSNLNPPSPRVHTLLWPTKKSWPTQAHLSLSRGIPSPISLGSWSIAEATWSMFR